MHARRLIANALQVALDKHGEDLRVLDVSETLSITDCFVLVTARNRRQAQAIASAIDVEMKRLGVPKARIEGFRGGWWVLLDFDEIVVHVFQEDARRFYDLDELWADAEDLTAAFLGRSAEAADAPGDPVAGSE